MQYQNVCLEAIAYTLPDERVSSAQLEQRLEAELCHRDLLRGI